MKKILTIALILATSPVFADAYHGEEDVKPDGKKTIIYDRPRHGALLPFGRDYQWDGLDRPKYWNGEGVDPHGVNYWRYWDEKTACRPGYASVWPEHCKEDGEDTPPAKDVPEPLVIVLLGVAFVIGGWLMTIHKQ